MDNIIYKLPKQIMDRHGDELRAFDWSGCQEAVFKLGDEAFHLEIVARDGQRIVRPKTLSSANRLRKYALSIAPDWKPTDEEVAAVLAKRNPKRDVG